MSENAPKGTYALISLGCPKNLVDSERMAGLLRLRGYRMVERPEEAQFVVINTCGFIRDARDESLGIIEEMLALKRQGRVGGVIVTGCLAERDREGLLDRFPEIDQVVGVFARDEITTVAGLLGQQSTPQHPTTRAHFREAPKLAMADDDRLRMTSAHVAYLKIAEGCDRKCAFCSIPQLRGPYASKPIEQVVAEAQHLADDGVRELVLVAQDTSYYGVDLYGKPRLVDLLPQLEAIDSLAWIRLMYLYPNLIDDQLIDLLSSAKKVLPYLDLPLQHINDKILRQMRRGISRTQTERLLDRLRGRIDSVVLRTTLLVGFPGEGEAEFDELVEFVQSRKFERLGVFGYSNEPGTPAEKLSDHPSAEETKARCDRLLAVQQEIAFAWGENQVGRRLDVLIDRDIPGPDTPGVGDAYVGRTYADAPEIDGLVYITGENLAAGRIVPCEIVAARDYDLIGAAVEEPR